MKTIFTQKFYLRIFICLVLLLNVSIKKADAQYVNIPDANFRNFLQTYYPSCMLGGMLDTTCPAVINATFISVSNSGIQDLTGIQYFVNLDTLFCGVNQLTFLPALPSNLLYIDCSYNQISSLSQLPSSLQYFNCYTNLLTSLPSLPPSLQTLICTLNNMTSLPNLPSSLLDLECGDTSSTLTFIPPLPSNLIKLYCRGSFTTLPSLPSTLRFFSCASPLISLPILPDTLYDLEIYHTQLTSLPNLPPSLTVLFCEWNQQISSLPPLPSSLIWLFCDGNQISSLPPLPSSLRLIYFDSNNLTSLPNLPDTIEDLEISNNPISCLPEMKNITDYFGWTNTNIHCLPNLGNIVGAAPPINTLPLCQLSDSCPSFWNISGKVFLDNNANCIQDTLDFGLENIPVSLDSGNVQLQQVLTNIYGEYSFTTGLGNYIVRVDTTNIPYQVVCPLSFSHTSVLTLIDSIDSGLDFGLQCNALYDLEARSISPSSIFVVGTQLILYLKAGDVCAAGISGTVQVILNNTISYVSPLGLTPSFVSGDTITWNISDFSTVNPSLDFNILVQVETTSTFGDSACIQLNVLPNSDSNPLNNFLSTCYPIRSSYDPNEKYMSPAGLVDTSQQWFTFTIFFQNTGNAPAHQISILDTLNENLDASTFTFLSSSHHVFTQLLPGNILRITYSNINLIDSTTDELNSHGYVQFKIKRKVNLPVGTTLTNTASIFFDFNVPVVTNQTSATLSTNVGIHEISSLKFNIYPNPSKGAFTLSFSNHFGEKSLLKIYNMLGETIFEKRFTVSSSLSINHSEINLQKGMYVVEITFENYSEKKKLMLE